MSTIVVDDVHKRYGSLEALRGVSLTLEPGELLVLVGPSGSGKTTLLNVVAGWEEPDRGSVAFGTGPSWDDLAVVPQAPGLLAELTLLENVLLPARLRRRDGAADVAAGLLERLGLDDLHGRFPDEVSHGQQQRAAIARALVLGPRAIAADEPTAHLDAASAQLVLDLLSQVIEGGTACLVTTHDPHVVAAATRVVHLHDGLVQPA